MADIHIDAHRLGDCGITLHKSVEIGSKRVDTPAKAIEIGKTNSYDQVVSDSRAINEIYRTFDSDSVENARRGLDRKIESSVQSDLRATHGDELNVLVMAYEETRQMSRGNLEWLVQLLDNYSDLIVVPLLYELARAATDDEQDKAPIDTDEFGYYKENVEQFLELTRSLDVKTPIMGTLPVRLPWECNEELLYIYQEKGVDAFCANFDGLTVTANSQIDGFVQPLFEFLDSQGIKQDTLLYAINAKPGQSEKGSPITKARDFMSVAHGFDILGENHIGMRAPPHVIEKIQEQMQQRETTIKVFDREEYVYRNCTTSDLVNHFPADSNLDLNRIQDRIRARGTTPYRIQALLNAEQMALASRDLRVAIQAGKAESHVTSKTGVGVDEEATMESVRDSFGV